ncbi:hypothetical protein EBT31_19845 [bacterium]|nr:hypothetical protein [bacterium]
MYIHVSKVSGFVIGDDGKPDESRPFEITIPHGDAEPVFSYPPALTRALRDQLRAVFIRTVRMVGRLAYALTRGKRKGSEVEEAEEEGSNAAEAEGQALLPVTGGAATAGSGGETQNAEQRPPVDQRRRKSN